MGTIHVFGDSQVENDALPLALVPKLKKRFPQHEFVEFQDVEALRGTEAPLYILDAVEGVARVTLIRQQGVMAAGILSSVHDPKLGHRLRLFKEMGWIGEAALIAVPPAYPQEQALREVAKLVQAQLKE